MGAYRILAEAFRYPAPGRLEQLRAGSGEIAAGPVRAAYERFLAQISELSLGEWEELYTRTLDLNPQVVPYLGYQRWGESYPRGNFMASMNRLLAENLVDPDGELPDHLVPVLRYLEVALAPPGELLATLTPALDSMKKALVKADPENPYGHLLTAAQQAVAHLAAPEGASPD